MEHLLYTGKLSREKMFANFEVLWLFASFLHAIWGHGIVWWHQRAICKSFLHENLLSTNLRKFSPTKVSCCTVISSKPTIGWEIHYKVKGNHFYAYKTWDQEFITGRVYNSHMVLTPTIWIGWRRQSAVNMLSRYLTSLVPRLLVGLGTRLVLNMKPFLVLVYMSYAAKAPPLYCCFHSLAYSLLIAWVILSRWRV